MTLIKNNCKNCMHNTYSNSNTCDDCHHYINWVKAKTCIEYPCNTCDFYQKSDDSCTHKKSLLNCNYEYNYNWKPIVPKPQKTSWDKDELRNVLINYDNYKLLSDKDFSCSEQCVDSYLEFMIDNSSNHDNK